MMFVVVVVVVFLLLSSIQHHDWRDSQQHAGVHWFARYPSKNNSGLLPVVYTSHCL